MGSVGEDPDARDLGFARVGRNVNATRGVARIADRDFNRPIGEGVEATEELMLEGAP
jgi:hypothetical protein